MLKRVLVALGYGVLTAAPVVNAALKDGIDQAEWSAIMVAFVGAAWGSFKSSQNILLPNREILTEDQRIVLRLKASEKTP
jgi:hypothetical protein